MRKDILRWIALPAIGLGSLLIWVLLSTKFSWEMFILAKLDHHQASIWRIEPKAPAVAFGWAGMVLLLFGLWGFARNRRASLVTLLIIALASTLFFALMHELLFWPLARWPAVGLLLWLAVTAVPIMAAARLGKASPSRPAWEGAAVALSEGLCASLIATAARS